MTKDELKKEAEEYQRNKNHHRLYGKKPVIMKELYKTYIDSAEPREKRIAELQSKVDTLQGFLDHDIEFDMDRKIQELEKGNAELKQVLEGYKENATWCDKCKQLTKARVLLAKWVELFKPKGGNIPPTPIQVDTEQFLEKVK